MKLSFERKAQLLLLTLGAGVLTNLFGPFWFTSPSFAQEKPASSFSRSAEIAAAKSQFPSRPNAAGKASPSRGSGVAGSRPAEEDQIRKRDEWFYKQRSSMNGHIPAGARLQAYRHMQRMMVAEGKLVLRPDGSYVQVAPQSWLTPQGTVTSTWTSIGPAPTTGGTFSPVTGRITTIAVDPSDLTGNTVLIGGAQGGTWRSTDAGNTWTAVGDQNPSLAMGAIAFAPSQPSVVYAGTGEQASIGFDIYYGAGVLKSADRGQTWTQTCTVPGPTCPFIGPYLDSIHPGFGFFNFGGARISYIAVNPQNPNLVLVAAQLGIEGPTEGIYCSSDGGATWSNILPDEMATFVGFASSSVAFAAFGMPFGSSPAAPHGNGIYKSTSATSCSATFTPLSGGLPAKSSTGRIDLGISPNYAVDNAVYASIADAATASEENLGVWITTNGGNSWTQTAAPDVCRFQCWYDNVIKVDPLHGGTAFFGGSSALDANGNPTWVIRTTNAGASWFSVIPAFPALGQPANPGLPHVDTHAIAFAKLSTGKLRMYLGNDGGIWRTDDAEAATVSWINLNNPPLTLTQFYPSMSFHSANPTIIYGGAQDNGSQQLAHTPSWVQSTTTINTPSGPVVRQVCGDGGETAVDTQIPSTVYVSCQDISIRASYLDGSNGSFFPHVNGINLSDSVNFIPPLATDPNSANVVYFGTTKVYQSADAGNNWTSISGGDLTGGSNGDVLTALAVAPGNSSVVYAGSSSGLIFSAMDVTPGTSFASFAQHPNTGIFPNRAVTAIAIDPADPTGNTAYISFSGFSFVGPDALNPSINIDDPSGHVFKTTNGGFSLVDVSCSTTDCSKPAITDLPNLPVNDIVLDPDLPSILYAATDIGVFVGNCSTIPCAWSTLGTGLPHVAVLSLRLHEASRTLRAGTHGRGAWDINLNNFTFSGPHISAITPTSANAGGAQFTLTVDGTGLTGGAIQWNGSTTGVTTLTGGTDTTLTATIDPSLLVAGSAKITVQISSTSVSNSLLFEVLSLTPTLTSINPQSTPVQTPNPTAGAATQLAGTNFAKSARVFFNGAERGITIASPTSSCALPSCLTATLPASLLGPYGSTNDMSVINLPPGGGKSQSLTFQVVAPPPINDNFANAINIAALSFGDVQDSSGATTESADPIPPCVHQSTSAQGNTGGHPNGLYNTIWYKFTPLFSANLNVDTTGSNYDTVLSIWTGSPGSFVNVACNDDINPGIVIQSQLLNVPLTAGTTYYIMVSSLGPPDSNPIALGGRSQLSFLYNNGSTPTPSITTISPTSASSGDPGFTLTVNGTGFLNGATVQILSSEFFFGYIPQPTTFVNSTQLTAAIPASAIVLPGPASVVVANASPTIGTSNSLSLTVNVGTYPVPKLTSLFPTSVIATTQGTVIDAGGDFFAPNAVLNFNGVPEKTTVFNPGSLNAFIPASQITVANVGTVQVTVSNPSPGGGPSPSLPFTIVMPNPIPAIESINPSSAPQNGQTPVSVTVTGSSFTQGAIATFNGFSIPTSFVSSTQLTVTLLSFNLSTAGTFPIVVIDPAPGGTSSPVNFTVTGPPDFSMTSSGTTMQTVSVGQTATFPNAISVSAQNGFSSQINLSCSLPLAATATTCAVNPNTFATGSGMATVTVTTMARGLAPPSFPIGRFLLRPRVVPLLLPAMFVVILLLRLTRGRHQRLVAALPLCVILVFLIVQATGCGGGSAQPTPPPPTGTPAGTYTVTVTGTSGTLTHATTLTLNVN